MFVQYLQKISGKALFDLHREISLGRYTFKTCQSLASDKEIVVEKITHGVITV